MVVPGAAAGSPAVERWDPAYLMDTAGDAKVDVAEYQRHRRDFGAVEVRLMTLCEFLEGLTSGHSGKVRYLFNNASCVFARNEERPEYHLGWAAQPNPGLAPLAAEPPSLDPLTTVRSIDATRAPQTSRRTRRG